MVSADALPEMAGVGRRGDVAQGDMAGPGGGPAWKELEPSCVLKGGHLRTGRDYR